MCKTGFIVIVTIVTNYDYQSDNLLSQELTVRVVEAGRPGRLGVSTESVGAVRFRKGQGSVGFPHGNDLAQESLTEM